MHNPRKHQLGEVYTNLIEIPDDFGWIKSLDDFKEKQMNSSWKMTIKSENIYKNLCQLKDKIPDNIDPIQYLWNLHYNFDVSTNNMTNHMILLNILGFNFDSNYILNKIFSWPKKNTANLASALNINSPVEKNIKSTKSRSDDILVKVQAIKQKMIKYILEMSPSEFENICIMIYQRKHIRSSLTVQSLPSYSINNLVKHLFGRNETTYTKGIFWKIKLQIESDNINSRLHQKTTEDLVDKLYMKWIRLEDMENIPENNKIVSKDINSTLIQTVKKWEKTSTLRDITKKARKDISQDSKKWPCLHTDYRPLEKIGFTKKSCKFFFHYYPWISTKNILHILEKLKYNEYNIQWINKILIRKMLLSKTIDTPKRHSTYEAVKRNLENHSSYSHFFMELYKWSSEGKEFYKHIN